MTFPLDDPLLGNRKRHIDWLTRYLAAEKGSDDRLQAALNNVLTDIDQALASLKELDTFTASVRSLQVALARKQLRTVMDSLFDNITGIIKQGHGDAASAAVDAVLADQASIMRKLFPDKTSRDAYGKSLQASAVRDIDATMTRILQTSQPLSKRVYKTRALSSGMVDRQVNASIAMGDSFTDLAKKVRHMVDPATPGGVSYASKRLARTEINNAFHAQSIRDAQEMPWVTQMRWNLSKRHKDNPGDFCEDYALQRFFPVEQVPNKPHPQCLCTVTPEPVSDDVFDHMLGSGQLDSYLDDFISSGSPRRFH